MATTDSEEQEYTLIYCVTRYVSFRSSRINLGQSVLNVVKKGGEAAYAMVARHSRRVAAMKTAMADSTQSCT